jgi:riboflavin kinase/FMN adenylyltransferase
MGPAAVTIGNFDGVHVGHAALVRRARELVGPSGRVVVLAFDPHPASLLRPGTEPARLTTFDQRAAILLACGADAVERLEPTPALLAQSPEAFIDAVVARHAPAHLVEGPDFHFGKDRMGTPAVLAALGQRRGFRLDIVPPVTVALRDQSVVTASSTLVRWLLAHARVRDAALVLGRPHAAHGVVTQGDRRGRTIGVPTANVAAECAVPAPGVYAGVARLEDGRAFPCAVNVGPRPSFDAGQLQAGRVEAHLLGTHPFTPRSFATIPGLPEYGWSVTIEFVSFLRDACRFATLPELTAQIARDLDRVGVLIGPHELAGTTNASSSRCPPVTEPVPA